MRPLCIAQEKELSSSFKLLAYTDKNLINLWKRLTQLQNLNQIVLMRLTVSYTLKDLIKTQSMLRILYKSYWSDMSHNFSQVSSGLWANRVQDFELFLIKDLIQSYTVLINIYCIKVLCYKSYKNSAQHYEKMLVKVFEQIHSN